MSSAVKLILGVSTLAMAAGFAGCDSGSSDNGGTAGVISIGTAGASNTAGNGQVGTAGSTPAGGGAGSVAGGDTSGVPLTPAEGWVDKDSNALGVQGAVFSFGDDVSKMGMKSDFTGAKACISGTAALVDTASTPCATKMFTAPATDCYGQFWGAAIGMNLNQPKDPVTMMGVETALAFDASMLKGFSFDIAAGPNGGTVPAPKDFRFKVEDSTGEYCNIPSKKLSTGPNTFLFADLVKACYKIVMPPDGSNTPAEGTPQKGLIKIAWQVVTNTTSTVPFDFCVSNVRGLVKDGVTLPPLGSAGSSGVAGAPAAAGAAGSSAAGSSSGGASGGTGGASAGSGGTSGASAGSGGKSGSGG